MTSAATTGPALAAEGDGGRPGFDTDGLIELCPGVIVQPGDTVVVGVRGNLTLGDVDRLRDRFEQQLPGVQAVILTGIESVMVYRPQRTQEAADG